MSKNQNQSQNQNLSKDDSVDKKKKKVYTDAELEKRFLEFVEQSRNEGHTIITDGSEKFLRDIFLHGTNASDESLLAYFRNHYDNQIFASHPDNEYEMAHTAAKKVIKYLYKTGVRDVIISPKGNWLCLDGLTFNGFSLPQIKSLLDLENMNVTYITGGR